MLAEKSPTALLEEYKTNILEDIVLTLCKKQSSNVITTTSGSPRAANSIEESKTFPC